MSSSLSCHIIIVPPCHFRVFSLCCLLALAYRRARQRARARRAAFSVPSFDHTCTHTHTSQHDLRHACMHPILVGIAVVRIALDIVRLTIVGDGILTPSGPSRPFQPRPAFDGRNTTATIARSLASSVILCRFCSLCCLESLHDNNHPTNKDNRDRQPSSSSSVSASDPGDLLIAHHS